MSGKWAPESVIAGYSDLFLDSDPSIHHEIITLIEPLPDV